MKKKIIQLFVWSSIVQYLDHAGDTGITVKIQFEADLDVEGVVLPLADFLTKE